MIKPIYKTSAWAILLLVCCQSAEAQTAQPIGINLSYIDNAAKPQNDFYRYVNGIWLDKTEIPEDRVRWGSADELRENTDHDVMEIFTAAVKNPKYQSHTDQGKAINLYKTIMDTVSRDKQGFKPLQPKLNKIAAIKNAKDLQKLLAEEEAYGGVGFFGFGVGSDQKNSNRNIVQLDPKRLGLPDRDYYTSDDKDSKEKREKYVLHVARMLQIIGDKPAEAKINAEKILALETTLARARFTRVEQRDRRNTYNPMAVTDLQKLVPSINWSSYFAANHIDKLDSLNVSQPKYMAAFESILKENKVDSWKAYLRWTALNSAAGQLSLAIEDANWEFYGKTLSGAVKQRPRDERALQTVNGVIGEAIGKLYVEKKFPAEAKVKAESMIKNIIRAFENRINNLAWMSAETKKSAITKLHKVRVKVGYPDQWKDYSALQINGSNYYDNMRAVTKWSADKDLADLHKPVDKEEWHMSPQTVNAYYNASYNEIVFPAAILQPPYYDYKADEAVNYGGIGAVIGHEISHGFDDSGSRYNAEGNLIDWWTEVDQKQFTALTGALADQYSALEPLPGSFVDGKFTLGENIGDLGGVNVAYDGLQLFLKENGNPGLIDGFTPEKRFFISWATVWRSKMRDEALKRQLKTDPHSPGQYRGYMPLLNVDSFYDAFNIKPGDGMYLKPAARVKIW